MSIIAEKLSFIIHMAMEEADERGKTIEFPFAAEQVERVYTQKQHPDFYGDGLWFQVKGGRIFNCLGEPDRVRKSCFSGPIEGMEARAIAERVISKLQGFKPTDYSMESAAD